jgi:hypothetical protein
VGTTASNPAHATVREPEMCQLFTDVKLGVTKGAEETAGFGWRFGFQRPYSLIFSK